MLIFDGQPLQPQLGNSQNDSDRRTTADPPAGDGDKSAFGPPGRGADGHRRADQGGLPLTDKESILVFYGQQKYNEWHFTVDLLHGGQQQAGAGRRPPPSRGSRTRPAAWR